MATHTKPKLQNCPECGKQFARASNLKKHMLSIHAKEKREVYSDRDDQLTIAGDFHTEMITDAREKPHRPSGDQFKAELNSSDDDLAEVYRDYDSDSEPVVAAAQGQTGDTAWCGCSECDTSSLSPTELHTCCRHVTSTTPHGPQPGNQGQGA